MTEEIIRDIDLRTPTGAIFSDDRKYRYALWRVWNLGRPVLLQIGLNPSKADEIRNDPTIFRGMTRAFREGFGGFLMANLYAYISTQPEALLNHDNTIGEYTDRYLKQMIEMSERQLCGWGSFKPVQARAPIVLSMIKNPYCLGVNADGQPKHPLYVGYDIPMVKYQIGGRKK